MEIKVSIDEAKVLKMAMDGNTEKEIASELRRQIKDRVISALDSRIREITTGQVKDAVISSKVIESIVKTELRPRLVKYAKQVVEEGDIDIEDILCGVISDNLILNATVKMKS